MWKLYLTQSHIDRVRSLLKFLFANVQKNQKLNSLFCDFAAKIIFNAANDFGPCGSMGIFKGQKLIAAIVFHGWQPQFGVMEISAGAISPSWLCKRSIREIMSVCFDQHGCQQIVSRMATDNDRAIKIYEFLGFQKVLLPNMRGSGKHEWLMTLTKDKWANHKFYEVYNGQKNAINS